MFSTVVIWAEKLTPEQKDTLFQQAETMNPESNLTLNQNQTEDGLWSNERFWDTQEQAQQWIDIVAAYNPVSATIISNN